MLKVTVYCHDRNEVIFSKTFDNWDDAAACVLERAKAIRINTSIEISDAE